MWNKSILSLIGFFSGCVNITWWGDKRLEEINNGWLTTLFYKGDSNISSVYVTKNLSIVKSQKGRNYKYDISGYDWKE